MSCNREGADSGTTCEFIGRAGRMDVAGPRTLRAVVDVIAENSFPEVLAAALNGARITRAGWNGSGMWVAAQFPDKGSKMTVPYLYMKNAQNDLVPWLASQGDVFANDWAILP